MSSLAHISDLHFGRLDRAVADELQRELNERRPELVVISGDMTQRARAEEFRDARYYVERFESPTLCIPGNHDVPAFNLIERFASPYRRYRRHFGGELCPWYEGSGFCVLGINTARSYNWSRDWSRGRINSRQMRLIHSSFADVPARKLRIVVTHHPFLLPEGDLGRGLVGRSRDALRMMSGAGVDLLLAGHLHKTFSGHVETGQEIVEKILVAQVSTSTSTRLRDDANAYNWIEIEGGSIRLTPHHWVRDAQSFSAGETQAYSVARHPRPEARRITPS